MSTVSQTRERRSPDGFYSGVMHGTEASSHFGPMSRPVLISRYGMSQLFEANTPNSSKDHKTMKDFQHYKCVMQGDPSSSARAVRITADMGDSNKFADYCDCPDPGVFSFWLDYGRPGQFNGGLDPWYVPNSEGGFVVPPEGLELLKLRGLQAMVPKIKANLNILSSLYEIKDIASIRGSIRRIGEFSKFLFSKFGGLGSRPLASAVARTTADGYLQWMFNLKPLISDIGGIYRALSTYQGRVNDLVNRSATTQKAHFMCPLRELSGAQVSNDSNARSLYNCFSADGTERQTYTEVRLTRQCFTDIAVFRSCMQFNYCYSAYQREHSGILSLLDALGVNFNPKYVWAVLPWSFVVDWVMNVSSWLDRFEVKNMEPKVNILQYCWSVHKSRRISVGAQIVSNVYYFGYDYGGTKFPKQYLNFPVVRETSYQRGTSLPESSSFATSGLSSTEMSLAAALIITRSRKKTRRPRK